MTAALAGPAIAQAAPSEGERLFIEGMDLMERAEEAGEPALLEQACARFQASYDAEKVVTPLLNLARCEERRGRMRRALLVWRQAADLARIGGDSATQELAQGAAKAIEEKLPRLLVHASRQAVIEIDGERVNVEEFVVVDPGSHRVRAIDGARIEEKDVEVRQGVVEVTLLAPAVGVRPGEKDPKQPAPPPERGPDLTIPGWVLIGVGGAAWIATVATSAVYMTRCDEPLECPENGFGDGLPEANLALWIAAPVITAVGATLLIVDAAGQDEGRPPQHTVGVNAWATPLGVGLGLSGSFR